MSFLSWAGGALLVQQKTGYADLGIYNAVMRFKIVPETIAGIVLAPLVPVLCESLSRKDMAGYHKTIMFSMVMSALMIIPPALLQIAAPWLTLAPYGREYHDGQLVVQWLMLTAVAFGLQGAATNILISMGRMWLLQLLGTLYVAMYLGLAWWLIPRHGAAGYAGAGCIATIISVAITSVILYREMPQPLRQIHWLRTVTLSLGLVVLAWLASETAGKTISLLIGLILVAGFVVYGLLTGHQHLKSPVKAFSGLPARSD
jgi:O-antigen/teichoic acid export membrane protein